MTRSEHNARWGANLSPDTRVRARSDQGPDGQYDRRCVACAMGWPHTWAEHDTGILQYQVNVLSYEDFSEATGIDVDKACRVMWDFGSFIWRTHRADADWLTAWVAYNQAQGEPETYRSF